MKWKKNQTIKVIKRSQCVWDKIIRNAKFKTCYCAIYKRSPFLSVRTSKDLQIDVFFQVAKDYWRKHLPSSWIRSPCKSVCYIPIHFERNSRHGFPVLISWNSVRNYLFKHSNKTTIYFQATVKPLGEKDSGHLRRHTINETRNQEVHRPLGRVEVLIDCTWRSENQTFASAAFHEATTQVYPTSKQTVGQRAASLISPSLWKIRRWSCFSIVERPVFHNSSKRMLI